MHGSLKCCPSVTQAVLWNMDNLQTESTPEEHELVITDVRFRPNSTHLATASFDGSVRLWDAANVSLQVTLSSFYVLTVAFLYLSNLFCFMLQPSYCLNVYPGRGTHVMSLDFHPKKNDVFCFCDSNNEIHYWSMNPFSCMRVSKVFLLQIVLLLYFCTNVFVWIKNFNYMMD